ncbi:hypothetical protein CMZ82_13105 [Lysobacteraceae bacterium NML93-0792]|nr:hypothetical protein CMZ82_13105 [Xanthomonadaceae bacterium NML93-0792]PBS14794.1 hypothetical protein CMZ81_13950 [Xanthomonadaceae bacterium NML93-0793]PBS18782.1 hypothetical protein CMZ80_10980 [Xanthomonadaceae bacterium NML93-0831]
MSEHDRRALRDHWDRLSALDPDRSIIDPNDRRGHKNRYLAGLRDTAMLESLLDVPAGSVLLDYGCGSGSGSRTLLQAGWQVIGLDISTPLLQQARTRCAGHADHAMFATTDGRTVPLADGSIAAAITYGVLIYCVSDEELVHLLGEFRRALQPGGRLILVEQVKRQDRIAEQGLKRFRTIEAWHRHLTDAGFSVDRSTVLRHGRFPGTIALQRGLVPRALWRGMAKLERLVGAAGVAPWDYADVRLVARAPSA